jgi:hypothetical protein
MFTHIVYQLSERESGLILAGEGLISKIGILPAETGG